MYFNVNKEKFLAALQKVQSVIPTKSTIPILSNLLLRAIGESIDIMATDLEVGVKVSVQADIEEKGKIAVNAKKLSEIVRSIPEENCLCLASEDHLRITSGKARFDMAGMSGEDFPLLPPYSETKLSFMDRQTLVDILRKTSFSISTDDVRYSINGLYIEKNGDTTAFVSTDGHRLSIAKESGIQLSFLKEGEGIILPKKGVNEIIKLFSRDEFSKIGIGLTQNGNSIVFLTDTALTIRLIEGKFVKYREVIPKEHDKTIRVNRMKLLSALRRVSILSETAIRDDERKTVNRVKLNLSQNNILISGKTEIGEAEEDMEVEYEKENMEIVCNARYLIEPLSVIEDEEVMLELRDPISPIVIKPCIDGRYLYVVMPMRSK